ncbi:MAG: hypothetical protein IPN76_10445 [Saprospiraceae bacterium]|nr:hypothetical protein [Saprospiraceae bacterium]
MKKTPNLSMPAFLMMTLVTACGKDESPEGLYPYFFGTNCEISAPNTYEGLVGDCLFTVFYDDFSDNDKDWNLGTDTGYDLRIDNGYLKLQTDVSEEYTWGVGNDVPKLSTFENFQIEFLVKVNEYEMGNESYTNPVAWGMSQNNAEDHHSFEYSPSSYFAFYSRRLNDSQESLFYDGFLSTFFQENTLVTVRKIGSKYYFFLDKMLVHETDFLELHGDEVFLGAAPGHEVWVDFFSVSTIF